MKSIRILLFLVVFAGTWLSSCSQHKPFYNDIQAFKEADKVNPPPQNAIVFVGSSSFTIWKKVRDYFPGYPIINRGFGGSTLVDAIEYANDVVIPYHPKQVVIYSGENDVATGTVSAGEVFNRFKKFYRIIRDSLPETNIVYVSMKPSPSRKQFMPVMDSANNQIKNFLAKDSNAVFVDVYHRMLDASGNPRPELFGKDMLHMKREGYLIWQEALKPVLKQ